MSVDKLQAEANILKAAYEKALAKLQKERELLSELTPDRQLAIRLHELKCNSNHTNGCGWYYEFDKQQHKWSGYAHTHYLNQAKALIKELGNTGAENAVSTYALVKSLGY